MGWGRGSQLMFSQGRSSHSTPIMAANMELLFFFSFYTYNISVEEAAAPPYHCSTFCSFILPPCARDSTSFTHTCLARHHCHNCNKHRKQQSTCQSLFYVWFDDIKTRSSKFTVLTHLVLRSLALNAVGSLTWHTPYTLHFHQLILFSSIQEGAWIIPLISPPKAPGP